MKYPVLIANELSGIVDADQDDLKRAHKKAIEHDYLNKAKAIEFFIIPEENDGKQNNPKRKTRHITKCTNRKRGNRITRPVKNQLSVLRTNAQLPFLKVNRNSRLYLESDLVDWLKGRKTILNQAK